MRVAIAGATGFIGRALCEALSAEHELIGLTRRPRSGDGVDWRTCDLYSLLQVERALAGCDAAVYLVHSMLPSARLTQASFDDLDLLLADNFARAASQCGVKHIVYLGGLLPRGGELPADESADLSTHLRSRLEVERALAARGASVTALRAGLVVGPGGSSLDILVSLVRRLPAMLTPKWTLSPTQPVALHDVVRAFVEVLRRPERYVGAFDIGGPDVMSYREMMARTARVLGKRRPMIDVPLFTPGLSKLWVATVTGAPRALVDPLIESLRHPMTATDNPLQSWLVRDAIGFEAALREAVTDATPRRPRVLAQRPDRRRARRASRVRSVQRLPRPARATALEIAKEYLRWLPSGLVPGLRCRSEQTDRGPVARFFLGPLGAPLLTLRLAPDRSSEDRALFYVEGGLLAHGRGPQGRFELRLTPDGRHVLAAIHDFRPALPWPVYALTHARAHAWVMRQFARRLKDLAAARR